MRIQGTGLLIITTHKSLSDEEEDVHRVQAVVDVFPERREDHNRLSVGPWQVIVVVTCRQGWGRVRFTSVNTLMIMRRGGCEGTQKILSVLILPEVRGY